MGYIFFFRRRRNIRYLSFAFIRLDGKLLRRPSIEMLNSIVSSFDPEILYLIMGYDALDFGYTETSRYFRLLTAILNHAPGRRVIMELSGGYNRETIGDYVKRSLKILDNAV
jgi:acetoin utilization deacetylase AcuC-like enzyme